MWSILHMKTLNRIHKWVKLKSYRPRRRSWKARRALTSHFKFGDFLALKKKFLKLKNYNVYVFVFVHSNW